MLKWSSLLIVLFPCNPTHLRQIILDGTDTLKTIADKVNLLMKHFWVWLWMDSTERIWVGEHRPVFPARYYYHQASVSPLLPSLPAATLPNRASRFTYRALIFNSFRTSMLTAHKNAWKKVSVNHKLEQGREWGWSFGSPPPSGSTWEMYYVLLTWKSRGRSSTQKEGLWPCWTHTWSTMG